jgi:filamentous hemagglutinin family protein
MDKLARTEKLTAQVSLALAAGMVSIMPVTYGAPVLDRVVEGGAVVKPNGTTTVITSNEQNNIINWKDFSINQGEKVQFDGGQKQHNYLNLVTGDQVSRINGTLEGGQDVYIVNPKGVVV